MSNELFQKHCLDCQLGVKLPAEKIAEYKVLIAPEWEIREHKLHRRWRFPNFGYVLLIWLVRSRDEHLTVEWHRSIMVSQ